MIIFFVIRNFAERDLCKMKVENNKKKKKKKIEIKEIIKFKLLFLKKCILSIFPLITISYNLIIHISFIF